MERSIAQYARLMFKLFVHGGALGGRSEFRFRLMSGQQGRYRLQVKAISNDFRATLSLRRGTSDLSAFEQVFAENGYNMRHFKRWGEINDLYRSLSQQGSPLILDLGANIGLASLYFAKNWPRAKIIAVEPEEGNYRVMRDNLAQLENAHPLHAAVASEDGAVKIINPDDEAWATRTAIASEGMIGSVKALSVQSLLEMAPEGSLPFIVKIDIEGFERNLFSGNTDWVGLFPIVIMEPHDWMLPGESVTKNFFSILAQQDRDFLILNENIVCMSNAWAAPCGRHEHHDAVPV